MDGPISPGGILCTKIPVDIRPCNWTMWSYRRDHHRHRSSSSCIRCTDRRLGHCSLDIPNDRVGKRDWSHRCSSPWDTHPRIALRVCSPHTPDTPARGSHIPYICCILDGTSCKCLCPLERRGRLPVGAPKCNSNSHLENERRLISIRFK